MLKKTSDPRYMKDVKNNVLINTDRNINKALIDKTKKINDFKEEIDGIKDDVKAIKLILEKLLEKNG